MQNRSRFLNEAQMFKIKKEEDMNDSRRVLLLDFIARHFLVVLAFLPTLITAKILIVDILLSS